MNSLMVIKPYFESGMWIFDDEKRDLLGEPFVCGMSEIIDDAVKHIHGARKGFKLVFSARPFPSYDFKLEWLRVEDDGNWYKQPKTGREGWICPALFKYFKEAPKEIYLSVEGLNGGT